MNGQSHPIVTNGYRWLDHFSKSRAKARLIPWHLGAALHPTRPNDALVLRSLQAWQLGETSDGAHLTRATERFLKQHGPDLSYQEAVALFIEEEQSHGEMLGRYLDLAGVARRRFDFGDFLFRRVRYALGNMELWTTSVLMVESIAQIYYKALADAGHCPVLTNICHHILRDEAHHIDFQLERLQIHHSRLSPINRKLTEWFCRSLFIGISSVVWLFHSRCFRASGMGVRAYASAIRRKIRRIEHAHNTARTLPACHS
ncbi:ferritin-like domain-containing protein [Sulfuriroseicoccus oceanibius]|uniref:Ferritin-like domain-containing protein n=1 Tax=Sulfuriroseicoccus oceanibius TaxID=2707525 RepID=A0A6B3LD24_9BACT|nr:ferritin-like domain-containing protein [Sulfuriroseicoccus oceanibius]QQL43958.1 ferritin-like domain-containing protein [Sulfuriroseicoccus oceanibius]